MTWTRDLFNSLSDDDLDQLFAAVAPEPMAEALREHEPEWSAQRLMHYIRACPDGRGDILAFFESDGPRRFDQLAAKEDDDVPLPEELKGWLGEGEES